jgi:PAS domain S-box-containing protein
MEPEKSREQLLLAEIESLRSRLTEPEATLSAIRSGEVDAFVVSEQAGDRVYALRSADPPFRVMVEEMREGAATLDRMGTILYANAQLSRLLGRPTETLRGSFLREFLAPEEAKLFEDLLVKGGGRAELGFCSDRGQSFPAQVAMSPVSDEGVSAYCLIVTDLTEQKRQTATAAAEETWREANRRKDEFLAILSHELRNPLAAIGNANAMLQRLASDDPRVRRASELIDRQVHHLGRMVDDLLDVSRVAQGKIELRKEVFDLAALVSRLVESQRLRGHRPRSIRLSLPEEPFLVFGDTTRLSQVVTNLLNNAEKFTRENGRIDVELARQGPDAALVVSDDGIGIPPENLERIFDLYAQGERPTAPMEGGLGIGLTIVRNLVELHGGEVRAVSEGVGQGSRFLVSLPILADAQTRSSTSGGAPASESVSASRVLVVEDHADSAEGLAALLRISGLEVEIATDGPSALARCRDFRPDLVLLDIGLPGMDGYEVGRRLRELLGSDARIVALTGYGHDEDRRLASEAGIDEHVLKPIRPEAIETLLRRTKRDG